MTELSPAAKAVMDAFWTPVHKIGEDVEFDRRQAAAALRAAADHLGYYSNYNLSDQLEVMYSEGWNHCLKDILHIADELEGH